MAAPKTKRFIIAAGLWLTLATSLFAADPQLTQLKPQGAQRGTEVEVHLHGVRLADQPKQVLFYDEGIEVSDIEVVDGKHVKCKFKLNADCQLGRHALRLRTSSGLSNLVTFHVSNLKEIDEVEPNDSLAEPQTIETNVVVNGLVRQGGIDVFAVEVSEGELLSVEIEGLRLGRMLFDPLIEIYDDQENLLVSSDDQPAAQQDAFVSLRAEKAGRLSILVREVAYRGSDLATYRLHVGRFPRPTAVYPPAAVAGQAAELRWIGATFGDETSSVDIPETDDSVFHARATNNDGISPTGLPLLVCEAPPTLEIEPNNRVKEATELAGPGVACGVISETDDKDFFRLPMKKGQTLDIRVHARSLRSPLDSVLHIYSPEIKYLKGNDDDRGQPDSYIRFKAPTDGDYYFYVEDRLHRGREEMVYAVEISKPSPVVELTLDERRRYVSQVINVPQGGRTAAMMTVRRKDVGGPMNVTYTELPAGVTAEAPQLAGNYSRVPILFTAGSDAALHAALPIVTAQLAEKPRPLDSQFRQQNWLVRGRNNVNVWSHYTRRPPVAVTKKLPFSVRIVEPKAPLVRGGSMHLKLVAERDEGFENTIGVRTLYNPPGVSTNQSKSIAKDKTEVLVPITANGKASLGDWKIVFLGRTSMNGTVECSTQLTTLKIAEPYFDVKIPSLTVHQDETVEMTVGIEQRHQFEGDAELTLLRLPAGVAASKATVGNDGQSATFQLTVAKDARLGRHRGVGCQIQLTVAGEPVKYSQGYVDLFVDPAPKTETAAKKNKDGGRAS